MDDTKARIISSTMKAVRQYGLEGVRIQNVSELAEISPGAIYRYFESKDQLLQECFTYVDKQAAAIRDASYFNAFGGIVHIFREVFPSLKQINQDILWLHMLTTTVMYAKNVVEGMLPDNQETEDTVFELLTIGLSGYLKVKTSEKK